jgi:hypothetical protein
VRPGATLLLVVLAASLPARAEDSALRDLSAKDPERRIAAVRALVSEPGEEVSEAIAKLLADREPEVVMEAAEALGARGDVPSRKALRAALRRFAKDEAILPVVVVALGTARDGGAAKEVGKLARRALGADARLARAAIDALGRMRDPESLRALMALHASADAGEKGGHPEFLEDIRESLRELTGLPFRLSETWRGWWLHARKGWRAAPLEPHEEAELFRHDGWRISVARPDLVRWSLERLPGGIARLRWRGDEEEARFAWVDVSGHAATEGEPATPERASEDYRKTMEAEFGDILEGEFGVSDRLAGVSALRHSVTGILRQGSVAVWKAWFLERKGILYTVSAGWESGASERVREEIESILASLRLL